MRFSIVWAGRPLVETCSSQTASRTRRAVGLGEDASSDTPTVVATERKPAGVRRLWTDNCTADGRDGATTTHTPSGGGL